MSAQAWMFAILVPAIGVELWTRSETIDYERIELGKYHHQVTVKHYPGKVLRAIGFGPTERVFVKEHMNSGYEDTRWYEIPDFQELSCIGPLSSRIGLAVRQAQFAGAPSVERAPEGTSL